MGRMAELPCENRRSPWALRAAIVTLALGLFGCDHATKAAAHAALAGGGAVPIVDGVVELRYAANDDTAFSILRMLGLPRSAPVLLAAAVVALAVVLVAWIAARRRATLAQHVGFAAVAAGALGNVVDRAVRGYVVDFIHVTRWPVFNVADVAVVVGAALLVMGASKRPSPSPAAG
jgi:signal peptidase II